MKVKFQGDDCLEEIKNISQRNRSYLRNVRYKSIQRKKRISKSVYGFDWYKHNGQYSKRKNTLWMWTV